MLFLLKSDCVFCVLSPIPNVSHTPMLHMFNSICSRHARLHCHVSRPHAGPLLARCVSRCSVMTLDPIIPRLHDVLFAAALECGCRLAFTFAWHVQAKTEGGGVANLQEKFQSE